MDVRSLIAQQKAALESPPSAKVDVVYGGELVTVEVTKLIGGEWQALADAHPPRSGTTDVGVFYNQATLPAAYPADQITFAGEKVTTEMWQEIYATMDAVHRNNIGAVMYGVNQHDVKKELVTLGKARQGQASVSPENSASRPAASKGGSRRKSPRTSTTKNAG